MKQYLLTLAAVALASGAYAQSLNPANGTVQLEEYSGGLSSIEVNPGTELLVVNRNCPDYAVLRHNGLILKQVPASNLRSVYSFEGYTTNIPGSGHITFFERDLAAASQFGVYTADIPEGFFLTESGTPVPAIHGEWKINAPYIQYSPAADSKLQSLSTIRLTFSEGGEVSFATSLEDAKDKILLELGTKTPILDTAGNPVLDEEGNPTYSLTDLHPLNIKIQGRIVELNFQEVTEPQRLNLSIPVGVFNFTVSDGPMASATPYPNNIAGATYDIVAPSKSNWTVTPLAATFEGSIPAAFTETVSTGATVKGWFEISSSADTKDISMVMASAPYLVPVNADGTYGEKVTGVPSFKVYKVDAHKIIVTTSVLDNIANPGELSLPAGTYALYVPSSVVFPQIGENLYLGRFTITAPEFNDYTVTPSTTEELDEIARIEVIFPEGSELAWTRGQYATIVNAEGTIDYNLVPTVEDNKLIIEVPAPITTAGEWKFNVGSAGLTVDGTPRSAEAVFTVKEASPLVFDATVSNGFDTTVTLEEDEEWGVYTSVITTTSDEKAVITIEIPEGYNEMYYLYNGAMGAVTTPAYRKTPASDVLAAGWSEGNVLNVAKGTERAFYGVMFGKDGEVNTDQMHRLFVTVLEGTQSGVAIVAADATADVYNVAGVKVLTNATSDDIANLPAGLYIVNGQKILVK